MTVLPSRYAASDPARMTPRARAYLIITAIQNGFLGYCCIFSPGTFKSSSFLPIISVAPLWAWGALFIVAGSIAAAAATAQKSILARLAMSLSGVSMGLVAGGLVMAMYDGLLSAPTGPIVWSALAAKDLVVCSQPMRSPFEALAERLSSIDRRRRR